MTSSQQIRFDEDLVRRGLAQKHRSNCILASENLAKLGITMRSVDLALRETMKRYAERV